MIDEFQRMGARLLTDEQTDALAAQSFTDDGKVQLQVLGQSCVNLAGLAGFEAADADKVLLAPLPTDLDALAAHPFIAEKLMPVLGLVRSPSVEHGIRACELVTEHGGLGHTSAVYATDDDVIERFCARDPHRADPRQRADRRRSARRRLQLDDADLLARLRHLGRLEHDRQRQLPKPAEHQDRVAPPDAAAVVPGARRTRTSTPGRWTTCASSTPPGR